MLFTVNRLITRRRFPSGWLVAKGRRYSPLLPNLIFTRSSESAPLGQRLSLLFKIYRPVNKSIRLDQCGEVLRLPTSNNERHGTVTKHQDVSANKLIGLD